MTTLTIQGYELLVVRAICEACQGRAFLPIDQFEDWVISHYLPGANLALVRDEHGAECWLAITTTRGGHPAES